MEFSERLKELRKKANFTQVEVAEKLGISQPAYASAGLLLPGVSPIFYVHSIF